MLDPGSGSSLSLSPSVPLRLAAGEPSPAAVDPTHLRSLIKGLPDVLKIHVQSLRERIQEAIDRNKQNPRNPPVHVLIWAEILHNLVTYGREIGWVDSGGSTNGDRRVWKTSRKPLPERLSPLWEVEPFRDRRCETEQPVVATASPSEAKYRKKIEAAAWDLDRPPA
ncbi:hypothetical protein AV530_004779 [Patagioenas fasciata monilis]|uniref:Uncharacterized protein n=1 Tax=Patagioenas fasciata monilis TaxID=372326 RepID=A0A1V4KZI4_PATFA|nr:hypothetical protein AV530_004779 [Patagioenas fasciata monilis]